jgi:hypothetical protein
MADWRFSVWLADLAYAGPHLPQTRRGQRSDAIADQVAVDRGDLRYIHNRCLRQSSFPSAQTNVARQLGVLESGGDRHDDGGRQLRAVEPIMLEHYRRPSALRSRLSR